VTHGQTNVPAPLSPLTPLIPIEALSESSPIIPVHPYSDDHPNPHYPSDDGTYRSDYTDMYQFAQPRDSDVAPNSEDLSTLLGEIRASFDQRSIIPPSSPHSVSPFFQPLVTRFNPGYDIASLTQDLGLDISAKEREVVAEFFNFCLSLSNVSDSYIQGGSVPQDQHVPCEIVRVIETLIHIIPSMIRASTSRGNDFHTYLNTAETLLHIIRDLSTLTFEEVADSRL
jgi:hypothetical protein